MEQRQRQRLDEIKKRFSELNQLLIGEEVLKNHDLFRDYSKEVAKLKPLVELVQKYEVLEEQQSQAKELLDNSDKEVRELALAELEELASGLSKQEGLIQEELLGDREEDDRNSYLEIRAGAGGDEAAIFGGDLLMMYQRYAESKGWKFEIISLSDSDQGGYKQAVIFVSGDLVYGDLKFESGTHRVQRVPKTEAKGRLHTSTCTVAILPEAGKTEDIEIKKSDLRIDTYRASGAGGQHVNKTDSAVRITHLPTGVVTECQDERSQHRNKEKAMEILRAKLRQEEVNKQKSETSQLRKSLVGSGDRAEKIRTYNFPQNRVTDHRIGLTLHSLDEVILGNLDSLIEPLKAEEKSLAIANSGPAEV